MKNKNRTKKLDVTVKVSVCRGLNSLTVLYKKETSFFKFSSLNKVLSITLNKVILYTAFNACRMPLRLFQECKVLLSSLYKGIITF